MPCWYNMVKRNKINVIDWPLQSFDINELNIYGFTLNKKIHNLKRTLKQDL